MLIDSLKNERWGVFCVNKDNYQERYIIIYNALLIINWWTDFLFKCKWDQEDSSKEGGECSIQKVIDDWTWFLVCSFIEDLREYVFNMSFYVSFTKRMSVIFSFLPFFFSISFEIISSPFIGAWAFIFTPFMLPCGFMGHPLFVTTVFCVYPASEGGLWVFLVG